MDAAPLDRVLQDAVDTAEVPGVVALAATRDGVIYEGAFGTRRLPDGPPMDAGTVFWLASMAKAVTSVAALQLVEQGRLELDAPIAPVLPALAAPQILTGFDAAGRPQLRPATRRITLRHLLTHTAGYGYTIWSAELAQALPALGLQGGRSLALDDIPRMPLLFEPGSGWAYGINTDLVGLAVETVSGQRLDAYLADHIFGPLGLRETCFTLPYRLRTRLAACHARQPDGGLEVVERAVGLPPGPLMGGGDLCGTGRDYLRFLRMLMGGGTLDGVRILAPETVAAMARNQIGDIEAGRLRSVKPASSNDADFFPGMSQKWGLGFLINTAAGPDGRSAGSLAWGGLANTYYWLDPVRGVAGVLLTQILPFADGPALALLGRFERAVYDSLA